MVRTLRHSRTYSRIIKFLSKCELATLLHVYWTHWTRTKGSLLSSHGHSVPLPLRVRDLQLNVICIHFAKIKRKIDFNHTFAKQSIRRRSFRKVPASVATIQSTCFYAPRIGFDFVCGIKTQSNYLLIDGFSGRVGTSAIGADWYASYSQLLANWFARSMVRWLIQNFRLATLAKRGSCVWDFFLPVFSMLLTFRWFHVCQIVCKIQIRDDVFTASIFERDFPSTPIIAGSVVSICSSPVSWNCKRVGLQLIAGSSKYQRLNLLI